MRDAFIVSAVRTPVGRAGGALADVRADDLAALAVKSAVERSQVAPASIDDVILGCTNQAGEDNRNVARMAVLLAGLPIDVPGQTVNRLCGSGLQAVASAAQAIKAGEGDVFVAGGVESMTRAPYVMLKSGVAMESRRAGDGRHDRRLALRQSAHEQGVDDLARHDGREGRRASTASPARRRTRSRIESQKRAAAAHEGRRVPRRDRAGVDSAKEGRPARRRYRRTSASGHDGRNARGD